MLIEKSWRMSRAQILSQQVECKSLEVTTVGRIRFLVGGQVDLLAIPSVHLGETWAARHLRMMDIRMERYLGMGVRRHLECKHRWLDILLDKETWCVHIKSSSRQG